MELTEKIFALILCHLLGDYFLQIDFIAKTKGDNFYHLLVHCGLYLVPFYVFFGLTWHLIAVFVLHVIVDTLKCRKRINYITDQVLHYVTLGVYFFG